MSEEGSSADVDDSASIRLVQTTPIINVESEENTSSHCQTREDSKNEKIKFKSDPPTTKEARSSTTIHPSGKFTKPRRKMEFTNSIRKIRRGDRVHKEEEEEEEYAGRHFTGRGYEGIQLYSKMYQPPSYRQRPIPQPRFPSRILDEYQLKSLQYAADETEGLNKVTRSVEENVSKFLQNKHSDAIPEDLMWKSFGKHFEYPPMHIICPHIKDHRIKFEKSEVESEKSRINLLYSMICEEGIIQIEDLWRVYLRRNTIEAHPFDGFSHFSRFISDRSHIFGVDQKLMVYNENVVVTVAVLRYVHALYHGASVDEANKSFNAHKERLFYRAFLSVMPKCEISYDTFFSRFPALFEFDEKTTKWKVRISCVSLIPSAFLPECLPRRNHSTPYLDRSVIFNGVGSVIANNNAKVKILSEDTLRSHIRYVVGVPIQQIENPAEYPLGTRVAFSGVRLYNGQRETVQGTRIEPIGPIRSDADYDGTIDVFTATDDEEINVECIEETCENDNRMSWMMNELASRERCLKLALKRGMKQGDVTMIQLYNQVVNDFDGTWNEFCSFVANRPFYYQVFDGDVVTCRQSRTRRKMIELLVEISLGNEGRSFYKEEVEERCSSINSSLDETMKFNLNDLANVLDYRKIIISTSDSNSTMVTTVSTLCYWHHQDKILIPL